VHIAVVDAPSHELLDALHFATTRHIDIVCWTRQQMEGHTMKGISPHCLLSVSVFVFLQSGIVVRFRVDLFLTAYPEVLATRSFSGQKKVTFVSVGQNVWV